MNDTLQLLEHGDVAVGAWVLSGSSRAAEVLSRTGLDWVGIDTEHAPYSPERVEAMVRAVEPTATPLVRVPSVDAAVNGSAKHALDSGAQGLIVPGIDTPTDAARVVRAASFPPTGDRGAAGTVRANTYGAAFDEYIATANDETLIVVQLESHIAIEHATDILSVDGIDVAFVGENDLSTALGYPGQTDHPEVTEAVQQVLEAARATGVAPGIAGRSPDRLAERADQGFRFFLLGADLSFMRTGIEPFLTDA